jgi:membrane protein DedA with SNARE-associated domain
MHVPPWRHWSRRQRLQVILGALVVLVVMVAALNYALTGDGVSFTDGASSTASYLLVFALVALDAVIPIFPGETTLNAAATAAAQGVLDLTPIIVMGSLGAIVGDSALFWLARRNSRRIEPMLDKAKSNDHVRQAFAVMDSSAPTLIVGGRYVPGMRFVVNATMGLSEIRYARFLRWSVLSGILWSTYTCVLAYKIGLALGEFPLASIVIASAVTSVALTVVLLSLRRHSRALAAATDEA